MRLSLITALVGLSGVIAMPISKTDLDSQMAVDGKLEIREQVVSSWYYLFVIELIN